MTDVHADTVLSRTRPWSVKVSPLRRAPSRNSRSWVCASLFSLLVLLSIAAACWYLTAGRVVYTNELYFDVGQVSHSTDVSAIAGSQPRTFTGPMPAWSMSRRSVRDSPTRTCAT
jgi:hypothetical protein